MFAANCLQGVVCNCAVRYGFIPTAAKPVVDDAPLSWCETGGWGALDLFAESQRAWTADLWNKRREVFWGKVATESADILGNSLDPLQVSEDGVSGARQEAATL